MTCPSDALISKAVPHLLRPLETGDRRIVPRLVHGNLLDGKMSTVANDDPAIAHTEGKTDMANKKALLRSQSSWYSGN